uniref:Uncharacterized protein n=1 Tax=Neobodo designis TaxID=312471 RepID=A0A7S1QGV9_NEODS|mmetsp:Transcript_43634/g.134736  ORF Transcript_43634/g.134736 Transcript_43634/m.134736 type:complete len:255 (+) Transcript_43634:74-838(+)
MAWWNVSGSYTRAQPDARRDARLLDVPYRLARAGPTNPLEAPTDGVSFATERAFDGDPASHEMREPLGELPPNLVLHDTNADVFDASIRFTAIFMLIAAPCVFVFALTVGLASGVRSPVVYTLVFGGLPAVTLAWIFGGWLGTRIRVDHRPQHGSNDPEDRRIVVEKYRTPWRLFLKTHEFRVRDIERTDFVMQQPNQHLAPLHRAVVATLKPGIADLQFRLFVGPHVEAVRAHEVWRAFLGLASSPADDLDIV